MPGLLTLKMMSSCRAIRWVRVLVVVGVAIGSAIVAAPEVERSARFPVVQGPAPASSPSPVCRASRPPNAWGSVTMRRVPAQSLPFSEEWDGTSWRVVSTPGPANSGLDDVSCPDATDCVAVGFSRYGTLAETWNGSAWTVVASPAPEGAISSAFVSVSCPTADSCSAVGSYEKSKISKSKSLTLAGSWNGSVWTLVPSPNPSGVTGSELSGVACADTMTCVAVGDTFTSTGNYHTLSEIWDGSSWSVVASPDQHPGQENELSGVSCLSVSECTAVGSYFARSGSDFPLIAKWNGSDWHLVTGSGASGLLDSIACAKPTACMAVGSSTGTFTERMHGKTWQVVPSPNPEHSSHSGILVGISCPRAFSCMAVGFYTASSSDTTYDLTESWDGSQWKLVVSPRP